jgi:hypothetical protein
LTNRQRVVFYLVAFLCATSRPLAMARSLWGWDEVLFIEGVRAYDVMEHHPHPPGYPLFIALGKFARLFTGDELRALQAVNLVAGALLFPAMFLLARELRMRFETAVTAGAICAFIPTVWFYGGTAFSDVTSIVIIVAAAALLLRGRESRAAFLGAAFLLGCAAAVRPQNLLIGIAPLAVTLWRRRRDITAALALIAAPIVVCYGFAAAATGGWARFAASCRWQSAYVARIDSFLNPNRASLESLFERFFIMQYGWNPLSIAITLLVLVSIISAIRRRDRNLLLNAMIFAPFALVAWLMLDPFSVRRYSIGYLPMFAIFAADGIERIAGGRTRVAAIIAAALIIASIAWTTPALVRVMTTDSPPVAAIKALRGRTDDLFVAYAMAPYVAALAPDRSYVVVEDEYALPLSATNPLLLADIDHTTPAGLVFSRPRDQLWQIALHRYFTVALEPVARSAMFGEGWSPAERKEHDEWRWMASRSVMHLSPIPDRAYLRLAVDTLPDEKVTAEIRINGVLRDRVVATSQLEEHSYDVPLADRDNIIEITTNGKIRLRWLGWGARNR